MNFKVGSETKIAGNQGDLDHNSDPKVPSVHKIQADPIEKVGISFSY